MVYKHKLPGQTHEFAAKIVYFSLKKCRRFLKEQLVKYNRYNFKREEDWPASDEAQYRLQASTAELTFRTLFCDKAEFASLDALERTLAQTYDKKNDLELLARMTDWYAAKTQFQRKEDDTSYTFLQGHIADELRSLLDPLTTPSRACEAPSLWPLVKEVQVGIPSSRVLQYLIFYDLPGASFCCASFIACSLIECRLQRYLQDSSQRHA